MCTCTGPARPRFAYDDEIVAASVASLLGLLFVNLDPGQLGSLAGIASLAVTILQLVAIVLLFRADARAWLSDDADDAEAP